MLIRTNKDNAVLIDFALTQPIAVKILHGQPFSNNNSLDIEAHSIGNASCCLSPLLTGDAGENREAGVLCNIGCEKSVATGTVLAPVATRHVRYFLTSRSDAYRADRRENAAEEGLQFLGVIQREDSGHVLIRTYDHHSTLAGD